jgi:regulatory protein
LKPPLSLKARALQWLAQREHSRLEMRRKLLRALRARAAASPSDPATVALFDLPAAQAEVDALLDWLVSQRYLSDERFADSRVHARATRFGARRIQQELSQHGLSLTSEQTVALRDSELERAQHILNRRFGARLGPIAQSGEECNDAETTPPSAEQPGRWTLDRAGAERARKARFLAGRGFSAEVIRRVIRGEIEFESDGS